MNQRQNAFLEAVLVHPTIKAAAGAAGISLNTATKYLKDPSFLTELAKRRDECISGVLRFLQGNYTKCAEELMKIVEAPDTAPQVKINAINAVFACSRSMAEAEILTRLDRLETEIRNTKI